MLSSPRRRTSSRGKALRPAVLSSAARSPCSLSLHGRLVEWCRGPLKSKHRGCPPRFFHCLFSQQDPGRTHVAGIRSSVWSGKPDNRPTWRTFRVQTRPAHHEPMDIITETRGGGSRVVHRLSIICPARFPFAAASPRSALSLLPPSHAPRSNGDRGGEVPRPRGPLGCVSRRLPSPRWDPSANTHTETS